MAAVIIHDHDVAFLEHTRELLFDPGAKAHAIDRSVEDARRNEPVMTQRAEKGRCAPMAKRREAAQARALRPPPRSGAMLVLIQVSSMNTRRR